MSGDLEQLHARVQNALDAISNLLLQIVQPAWSYAVGNIHRKYKIPCGPSDTKPVLAYTNFCYSTWNAQFQGNIVTIMLPPLTISRYFISVTV